jgi:hypothetical protein
MVSGTHPSPVTRDSRHKRIETAGMASLSELNSMSKPAATREPPHTRKTVSERWRAQVP